MKHLLLAAGLILAASPSLAATTLDFDSYIGESMIYSDGSLIFNNLYSLDTRNLPNSGYANSVVSGHNVAFNPDGRATTITGATPFSLISADLGAAWSDGLTVTFAGSLHGNAVYTQSFVVDTSHASFVTFARRPVDTVVVTTIDGIPNTSFNPNHGKQFSLDNLTYGPPLLAGGSVGGVPEPASWALMIAGFGLIGVAARRRAARGVAA